MLTAKSRKRLMFQADKDLLRVSGKLEESVLKLMHACRCIPMLNYCKSERDLLCQSHLQQLK